jgi:hypothetical protein
LETLQAAVKTTPSRHLLDIVLENYDLDKWPTFPIDDAINGKSLQYNFPIILSKALSNEFSQKEY